MYSLVLVPLDGSATAARGFDEALQVARLFGAAIRVVHVVDVRRLQGAVSAHASVGQLLAEWRAAGSRLVDDAVAKARVAGVEATGAVLCDPRFAVSELIVEEARRCGAGLLVLGTHGRRGFVRAALGSSAESVVRESPVPVLLVRPREAQAAPPPGDDVLQSSASTAR